ncbi:alginate lyase family protein [Paenibacillus sp. PL2-23]|uniref:alginate lyase family protein n=1 Tax=Paenibacillus sp. PL2-23 TaxID=2100729 RepID=UPI00349E81A4
MFGFKMLKLLKRALSVFIATCVCISLISSTSGYTYANTSQELNGVADASVKVLFDESYANVAGQLSSDWKTKNNISYTENYMELYRNDGNSKTISLERLFSNDATGVVTIELEFANSSTDGGKGRAQFNLAAKSAEGTVSNVLSFQHQDNLVNVKNVDKYETLKTVAVGEKATAKIVVDTVEDKIYVGINGDELKEYPLVNAMDMQQVYSMYWILADKTKFDVGIRLYSMKASVPTTEELKIQSDLDEITIENMWGIKDNFIVPLKGTRDTAFSWTSDNTAAAVNNETGQVTITRTELNQKATLIVAGTLNGKSAVKEFDITIIGEDTPIGDGNSLVYLNEERLNLAKNEIELNNPTYKEAFDALILEADVELAKEIDPVTNKTLLPASGDIHDYYSISPYHWPDPTKENGLPWIYKDGQFNPIAAGPETDWKRLREMFTSLDTLTLAYYFTEDQKYINKAKEIVQVWFINEETKVNPNVNFGQAIPGKVSGTMFGIIEWTIIGNVITTVQMLVKNNLLAESELAAMNDWFNEYLNWLRTSEFGIGASTRTNNHATNYDYQVAGLMIYLGKVNEAEALIKDTMIKRIETHIAPDGSQPEELKRTKSVSYTVNNLWALARLADLSRRFTNVDLWSYKTEEGVSLKSGYDFVIPYILGEKEWTWQQITGGGVEASLKDWALPMFSRSELMLGEDILPAGLNGYHEFNYRDILAYAPLDINKDKVPNEKSLTYLNEERLSLAKNEIELNNPTYKEAFEALILEADVELAKEIDPVTNKTLIPASGDIHDYYSIAPYWWPNPDTENGMPWIHKDGLVNPMTRGSVSDYTRLREMFTSLDTLTLAYYFTEDQKYINKAKEIVQVWFINEETKVNPNVNFGQAIPGKVSGTMFGIIEWTIIGNVITTVQMLVKNNLLAESELAAMNDWFNEYLNWLRTSEFGIGASTRTNNHATNYDYQVAGLMIYLGKVNEAEALIKDTMIKRIETHIAPDGSQPEELRRTKSVSYTVNNLWALARLADLSRRFTNVDLWSYKTEEGVSLKSGYDFVIPYILGEKEWTWQQITGGGVEASLKDWALPMFSRSELMLDEDILPAGLNGYHEFSYRDILVYAPLDYVVPTYDIATITDQTATALTQGYQSGSQESITIQVYNNGTGNLANLKTAVTGTDFVITQPSETLNSGATTTFMVRAKDNLSAGTYTETITISADNLTNVAFRITQVVNLPNAPAFPLQPLSSTEDHQTNVEVLVNGKIVNIGIATIEKVDGQRVTTVVVDEEKLQKRLEAEGERAILVIPVETESEVVIGELNGRLIKNMESKQAVVEVRTENAAYTLPAQQINIKAISERFGMQVALEDIKVKIEIAMPTDGIVQVVGDAASKSGFTIVAPPVNFKVYAVYNDRTEEISKFNSYVERTIAIPEGIDPNQIMTGVVVEPDGSVRHVPTKFISIDSKSYAQIKSLTNSTYSVVSHPRGFKDVKSHWAMDAINNMGSRMIIQGTGNEMFSPNRDITRAEFVAIIVRSLGLKQENGTDTFSDVKTTDWYSSAINTAYSYNLINGFEDETFRPNDRITREQAIVIISRAMLMTDLKAETPTQSTNTILSPFQDASDASTWAIIGIADSVQANIISGKSNMKLAPKDYMTRAEVATIVERLLQESELI